MAIKKITNFKGDSWKKQEEESPRAYHYFKQYKKQHLSKTNFINLILSEADERTAKGQVKFWTGDSSFNKEHQESIQKYVDSGGDEGQCPKPCGAIIDWFDLHKWYRRRIDYTEYQEEEADMLIRAMLTTEKPQIAEGLIENIKLTNRQRKIQKQSGQGTLSQDEAGAKAINTDIDSLNKLSNNDVQKVDVVADIEAKTESKLAMDFDSAYDELINDTRKDSLHLKDSE